MEKALGPLTVDGVAEQGEPCARTLSTSRRGLAGAPESDQSKKGGGRDTRNLRAPFPVTLLQHPHDSFLGACPQGQPALRHCSGSLLILFELLQWLPRVLGP